MKFLINIVAKLSGLGSLWALVDGHKTKIAAVGKMLIALGGLIGSLDPMIAGHDFGAIFQLIKHISENPHYDAFLDGLGVFGLGHKAVKLQAALEAPKA